jgi:hypothetical protein
LARLSVSSAPGNILRLTKRVDQQIKIISLQLVGFVIKKDTDGKHLSHQINTNN